MIAPYSADHEPSTPIQNRGTGDALHNGSRISLDVMEREQLTRCSAVVMREGLSIGVAGARVAPV